MRFIHTADINFDSPLCVLASYQDAPAGSWCMATRDAFSNVVNEAVAEAVEFVVIVGDLYDENWKD
jgi:DNA repair exonuclease SbcCD nuclease subunit